MANRDFKKIERIMKDFSANVGEGSPIEEGTGIKITGEDTKVISIDEEIVAKKTDIGDGRITITQGGTPKGTFNVNQKNGTTIELDDGQSGSVVVANPKLAGDEPELTSLEIDGTKYKVPEGGEGGSTDVDFCYAPGIALSYEYLFNAPSSQISTVSIDWSKVAEALEENGFDLSLRIGTDIVEDMFIGIGLRPSKAGLSFISEVPSFVNIQITPNNTFKSYSINAYINDADGPNQEGSFGVTIKEALQNFGTREVELISLHYCFDNTYYPYSKSALISNAAYVCIGVDAATAVLDIKPINLIKFAKYCLFEGGTSA